MKLPRYAFKGEIGRSFPQLSAALLQEYGDKMRIALERLDEEQIWWRPNEKCNSVGNLVLHVCGNLSLWLLSGLGGDPYERDRAGEFGARETMNRAQLLDLVDRTVSRGLEVLADVDLDKELRLQGYHVDGRAALYHTIEHASQHTGQILYIVKQLAPGFDLYPQHRDE